LLVLPALLALGQPPAAKKDTAVYGYTDTPVLPGQKWRVHDAARPHPRVVTPGTESTPQQPGRPPSDAIVLFNGKDLTGWTALDKGGPREPAWKVENGVLEVVPGTGHLVTQEKFGDCQLHLEWATPKEPRGAGQMRGNSGVMLMSRYEIQVLESYDNRTYADGQAASIYGQYPPLVNASRPPGEWQSYDIVFEAPRFEGEKVVSPAYITVFHNGVVVHHRQAFIGRMAHARVGTYEPHGPEEPLMLQNHGDRVRYRNLWIRKLRGYDEP
jgi:hypothetical protein